MTDPVASPYSERANTIPWPPLLFAGALALAYGLGLVHPLAWPGLNDMPAHALGLLFGLAGMALTASAILALSRHATTVRPDRRSDVLVTSGPYRYFRNPIYLGEVLMLLGLAEVTQNVWYVAAAALFGVLVTVLQIVPEERHLAARFGEAYETYRQRTRRWI